MSWKEVFLNIGFLIFYFLIIFLSVSTNNPSFQSVFDFSSEVVNIALLAGAFLWVSSGFLYFISLLINKWLGPKKIESESLYLEIKDQTQRIQKIDPTFNANLFLKNCEKLARKLNDAWCNDKMEIVRNLVSAGVYNRFKIQLRLMKSDGIKNVMDHWILKKLILKSATTEGEYQTVHVEISAMAKDINTNLNSSKKEIDSLLSDVKQTSYTEIWSFIRRKGVQSNFDKSLLSGHCPNCGAGIDDLGELNKCKSCGSIINSGEYDWVLSEITQFEEWNSQSSGGKVDLSPYFNITPLANKQMIEDRASFLFWRWLEANAIKKKEPLLRDSTKGFLNQFNSDMIHFHDTAIGAVDLQNFTDIDNQHQATVLILWSGAVSKDSEPVHQEHKFYLKIPINTNKKSGLSENSCETCGAPLPESDSLKCEYCGSDIPPVVSDWLLDRVERYN